MRIANFNVRQNAFSKSVHYERQEEAVKLTSPKKTMIRALMREDAAEVETLDRSDESMNIDFLTDKEESELSLLEILISAILGKDFKFSRSVKIDQNSSSGIGVNFQNNGPVNAGIQISGSREIFEAEKMTFSSEGTVQTSDGRTIDFQMNLGYSREYYERLDYTISIGTMYDPLVIDIDGSGIAFGEGKIQLDIDLDGHPDTFRRLAEGSGFLVLDKNDNGVVDDGTELFGPKTGSGFGELNAYDSDFNGWIDENDEIYNSLKVWVMSPSGKGTLIGLKEAGVGAIYLRAVSSPYTIKEGLDPIAKIKNSSVYLKEDGQSAAIHEIDLKI